MGRRKSEPTVGHNSGDIDPSQLRAFVERIERVQEEILSLKEDEKEIFAEAKGSGFDVKIMRKVLALRAMDADKRAEEEAMIDLYMRELGQLANTPLGNAAVERLRA